MRNRKKITEYALKILVQTDFPLLSELNRFIDETSTNGLIVKWLSEAWIRPVYEYKDEDLSQITMGNCSEFFILLICIWLVPSFVFIVEKIVFKAAHQPNASKFSILFEKLIDGDRHILLNDIRFQDPK